MSRIIIQMTNLMPSIGQFITKEEWPAECSLHGGRASPIYGINSFIDAICDLPQRKSSLKFWQLADRILRYFLNTIIGLIMEKSAIYRFYRFQINRGPGAAFFRWRNSKQNRNQHWREFSFFQRNEANALAYERYECTISFSQFTSNRSFFANCVSVF